MRRSNHMERLVFWIEFPTQSNREDFRRNRELIRPNREFSFGISERADRTEAPSIVAAAGVLHRGKLSGSVFAPYRGVGGNMQLGGHHIAQRLSRHANQYADQDQQQGVTAKVYRS